MALTEPLEAAVVATDQSAESATPKRSLLALHVAAGLMRAGCEARRLRHDGRIGRIGARLGPGVQRSAAE